MAIVSKYLWNFEDARRLGQRGLLAFLDATFSGYIRIHGLRIYERRTGNLTVSFPFVRRTVPCDACGRTTPYDSPHCIECGEHRYTPGVDPIDHYGMQPNVCHPASREARQIIEHEIIAAYRAEVARLELARTALTGESD